MAENSLAKLLQNEPLYRKVEVDDLYYHPEHADGATFQFFCPNENTVQTFKLNLGPLKAITNLGRLAADDFYRLFDSYNEDSTKIDAVNYYVGTCQYCNKYHAHFLLHVFSEGDLSKAKFENKFGFPSGGGGLKDQQGKNYNLYIRKLGQWPSHQIKPDTVVYNFLDADDKIITIKR
jgi:hypothetical protein